MPRLVFCTAEGWFLGFEGQGGTQVVGVLDLYSFQDFGWLPTWVLGSGVSGERRACKGYPVTGVSKGIYL